MPAQNYVLLERIELNATAASVDFSNIPQTGYTDLKLVISARVDASGGASSFNINIAFNGVSTNRTWRLLEGYDGTNVWSNNNTTARLALVGGSTTTASTFNNAEIYIPNYAGSNNKSISSDFVSEQNSSTVNSLGFYAGLWSQTAAINQLTLTSTSGSFVQYSTFSLYGLAALGTTPTIAPKASGGNVIDFDGTYWIHTFTSSGSFVPAVGLTCDYLVVAGAGGGSTYAGGGGGAGGYKYATSQSLSTTNYTVTVGAGGAGYSGGSTGLGSNGSDSVFNADTMIGGGRGGAQSPTSGASGGSGGGAAGISSATGGAGTSGQGNAGGDSPGSSGGGGGGGGSSAVGSNGTNTENGGAGGAGTANSITSTSVTRAGGGGGAGSIGTAGAGAAGGGNGGDGVGNAGSNATVNTGSGGGGAWLNASAGNGGSGIVIIRYLAA